MQDLERGSGEVLPIGDGVGVVDIRDRQRHPSAQQQKPEQSGGNLPSRTESMLRRTGLDNRLIEAVWADVFTPIRLPLQEYGDDIDTAMTSGRGLILFGGVGTGKSMAAALVMRAAVATGRENLRWFAFADLMTALENPYVRNDELKKAISAPFLVLDDFGTAAMNAQHEQWLDQIVDARYRKKKPTVVTTNLEPAEIMRKYPRAGDRWKQSMRAVPFGGKSRRQN